MNEEQCPTTSDEVEMRKVLEQLLSEDTEITARAVARLHPSIRAASSITRSDTRRKLLTDYQTKQAEYRGWRSRASKSSGSDLIQALANKTVQIDEMAATNELLIASHKAMLRAVGELGGYSAWSKFYDNYREVRDGLKEIGAIPSTTPTDIAAKRRPRKR